MSEQLAKELEGEKWALVCAAIGIIFRKLNLIIQSINRFQGYICPGILVMIANSSHIELVSDAWHRRMMTSPESCRISQVGVSNGCLVKPIVQTHTMSLPDFLCLQLARYCFG